MLAAVIGGGAVVAMGLMSTVASHDQVTAKVIQTGGMRMGGTEVEKAPPTVPMTTFAVPPVKAPHR